jgi:hypothetical protein
MRSLFLQMHLECVRVRREKAGPNEWDEMKKLVFY